jgi:hypothetical protein
LPIYSKNALLGIDEIKFELRGSSSMAEAIFKYFDNMIQGDVFDDFLDRRLVTRAEWADRFAQEEYFDLWGEHHDPLEILEKDKLILILGEAGSGKTTLLRHIFNHQANSCLEPLKIKGQVTFPVYVNFSRFKQGDLLDYFKMTLPPDIFSLLQKRPTDFKSWRFIYLLDGLDEIPLDDTLNRLRNIISKTMDFRTASDLVILSSRPIFYESYRSTFELWPIQVYHLARLTWEQISFYCKQKGCEPEELFKESARLDFDELLRNPLNLKLALDLLENEGQLPSTKSDLFERIVQWKTSQRHIRPFERKGLLEGLRDIALVMEMLQRNYLTGNETTRVLHEVTGAGPSSSDELIEELEITGMIIKSEDIICFEHRTLGEYLAATRLRNEPISGLREYILVGQTRLNPSWANTASFLLETNSSFRQFCCLEVPSVCISASPGAFSLEQRQLVFDYLYSEMNERNPHFIYSKPGSLRALARFIPESRIEGILKDVESKDTFRKANAIAFSIFIKDKALASKLRKIALDEEENDYVRLPALDALGEVGCADDLKALYAGLPLAKTLQGYYLEEIARLTDDQTLPYLLASLRYNGNLVSMSVIDRFKSLKTEKALLTLLRFLLEDDNIRLLKDSYLGSYFEEALKNLNEIWSEEIAEKLADLIIRLEESGFHIERDLKDILTSVLRTKDQQGRVVLKVLETAITKKLQLIYIDSIIGSVMLPSHAIWLVKNTDPADRDYKVSLAHEVQIRNNEHRQEAYKILLQSIPGLFEAKDKTAERYANEEAEKRKERKKKEWRGQEVLRIENDIAKIIRLNLEIDPAVWPEISPQRKDDLRKLVEKHLIDSFPQKHMNIISEQQFTCNKWLYESEGVCLKILDHYDLKLDEPSILINHLYGAASERVELVVRYFRRNGISEMSKDKFKELFTPDLPHIALSGFLNLLSELPSQFDVNCALCKIAINTHRGLSERREAIRLLWENRSAKILEILKELAKDPNTSISELARGYLIELQDLEEINRFFGDILNERTLLPSDIWGREDSKAALVSKIKSSHPQVLIGFKKIIDFTIEKDNSSYLEMVLNSLSEIDPDKAIEEIDKRIATQTPNFRQRMTRIREQIDQKQLLGKGKVESIDVAIKKIQQIKSPKLVVIYCEGETDAPVFKKFVEEYRAKGILCSEVEILINHMYGWPNVMIWKGRYNEWIRMQNQDLIIILDGDPDYFKDNRPNAEVEELLREWQLLGIRYRILSRPGIELYFPKKIIEEAHGLKIPEDYLFNETIPLYDQLKRLQEKGVLGGELLSKGKFKRKNHQIAGMLSVTDIQGTDLESFFLSGLKQLVDSII